MLCTVKISIVRLFMCTCVFVLHAGVGVSVWSMCLYVNGCLCVLCVDPCCACVFCVVCVCVCSVCVHVCLCVLCIDGSMRVCCVLHVCVCVLCACIYVCVLCVDSFMCVLCRARPSRRAGAVWRAPR